MIENVIIADDSSTARMIIKRCLEIAGCVDAKFFEAANGEEAINMAKNNRIDLIVTDLNMPLMDGRTLLKRIKASPKLTELPIIVISSATNETTKDELLKQGALAVLNKPVSPASVADALQNLTEQNQWGL